MDTMIETGGELGFARLLKRYREVVRMSQSRLAEAAGFDHSYVSRLESGNRTPTREAVVKLAQALGLDEDGRDSLLAAAGYMPDRVESLLADEPVVSEVLRLLQNSEVPEDVRNNVRQMLRLMVQQAQFVAATGPLGPDGSPAGDILAAD